MDIRSRVLRPNGRVRLEGILEGGPNPRLTPYWIDPVDAITTIDSMAVDLLGWRGESSDSPVIVSGMWTGSAVAVAHMKPLVEATSGFRFAPLIGDHIELKLPAVDAVTAEPDPARRDALVRELVEEGAALHYSQVRTASGMAHVVSAADVDAVEHALRPLLQVALVVIPSAWTRSDLNAVQQLLGDEEDSAGLFMTGTGMDPHGRFRVSAWVRQITPRLAAGLAAYPEGIVVLDSWLEPTHEVA